MRIKLPAWRIFENRFMRSVLVLAFGTGLGQCLMVLSSPLLTRLYTPEDFGILAVYISILLPFIVVASLRYEQAIPLPEEDFTARKVMALSLYLTILMSALSGLSLWAIGGTLAVWTSSPSLLRYLWLIPPTVFAAGCYRALSSWAIRQRAFTCIARTKLNQGIGQVVAQVGLGYVVAGPFGLLLGHTVSHAAGSIALIRLLMKSRKSKPTADRTVTLRDVASRYRQFPMLSSTSALLNTFGSQLPSLLVIAFYGPVAAGWFALSERVMGVPMLLVGRAVAQVYLGESARLLTYDRSRLITLFRKTVRIQFLVGIPVIVAVAAIVPWGFPILFGQEWREAGICAQALTPMFLLHFVSSPISATVEVMERQDLHFLREFVRLVLMNGAIVLASVISPDPFLAFVLLGIGGSISCLFSILLAWVAIHRRGKQDGTVS